MTEDTGRKVVEWTESDSIIQRYKKSPVPSRMKKPTRTLSVIHFNTLPQYQKLSGGNKMAEILTLEKATCVFFISIFSFDDQPSPA